MEEEGGGGAIFILLLSSDSAMAPLPSSKKFFAVSGTVQEKVTPNFIIFAKNKFFLPTKHLSTKKTIAFKNHSFCYIFFETLRFFKSNVWEMLGALKLSFHI